jgi:hypothetical protein
VAPPTLHMGMRRRSSRRSETTHRQLDRGAALSGMHALIGPPWVLGAAGVAPEPEILLGHREASWFRRLATVAAEIPAICLERPMSAPNMGVSSAPADLP